ncbi:SHOCT domain-containing protein [Streptomyces luteolifulvus]|jgi:putative membrane protein|uniref:SHOCT domain-containing protein n=1 Tax=Streptomyces luteolifulvus TaxID=2615112 RepID=A0A6H9UWX9_9ACTN|nr:SHOCT domain-containing protein [Streptomyces luteolifulvus]KAB1143351.1 SHOCT domain-containing protein [Streptomyces luteolifulvus]
MFWYGHDLSGWGWFTMSAGMIVFWALIITFGVLLYRALARPGDIGTTPGPAHPRPTPEQLLAERFARGEIEEEEYERRLTTLRGRTEDGPRLTKS